jgi:pyruvate dehydrogenase E2 component (dihydrolipoamide acetyltransferase)
VTIQTVSVPDIGGTEGAEVIEVSIAVGDTVEIEQSIIVLETDKASMDIPSSLAGKVTKVNVTIGDKLSEGDAIIELEVESEVVASSATAPEPAATATVEEPVRADLAPAKVAVAGMQVVDVKIPDGAEGAEVIEVMVAVGDVVAADDSLIVLETDKASMEIPAPTAGKIISIIIKQGDTTEEGGLILTMEVEAEVPEHVDTTSSASDVSSEPMAPVAQPEPEPKLEPVKQEVVPAPPAPPNVEVSVDASSEDVVSASQSKEVYAGPAIRKFAREMGIDLTFVKGTGDRNRVTKDDVKVYVKDVMSDKALQAPTVSTAVSSGTGIPSIPAVDFSQFGDIDLVPMTKIKKLTAQNMSRNWLNVPHVTQFDDADITDLETFRKGLKAEAEKRGIKLTPLPFLLKACAAALVAEPSFNVSLHHDGEHMVHKKYVNIGVAVDSPIGLVVPVIRDVDKKGLWELAEEFMVIIDKARNAKLGPKDMQGGCFTISSLGAMGGQGFTPIVNAPEVAILGVSRAEMKPKWNGSEFEPRNMLPLSLSYDHRAVNGADAGRFFGYLNSVMGDVRRLLL